MVQSLEFITTSSHSHVNNKHKKLKFNQIRDLKTVDAQLQELFGRLEESFNSEDFSKLDEILKNGKKPADLPFQTVPLTDIVINEKTLGILGITIPEDIKSKARMVGK